MSTIGSLGSYAAQLWHTRANPTNQEQFELAAEKQAAKEASATVDAKVVADSGSSYDEEAFAKLKVALNAITSGSDSSDSEMSASDSARTCKSASEEFHEWMSMTPGEKLRASILEELGITEEDLANMTPEARQNVEAGIAEKVQTLFAQQVHENTQEYRADHGDTEDELINLSV
ncbi:hypothetical protein [Pseudomonas turukhanskensis]|uniref:Uncharacterized protein n=1 Tax=Pseudomonas turukhanskensis TaxID=1806536 RepID=A0A9W6K6G6_9PSED|nr:hypothetical protein [Pseudomonas turukhanskensis]GLK89767.1 hypothetical protein GCM10017655_28290 [Pseudomonas turukhanskensis]